MTGIILLRVKINIFSVNKSQNIFSFSNQFFARICARAIFSIVPGFEPTTSASRVPFPTTGGGGVASTAEAAEQARCHSGPSSRSGGGGGCHGRRGGGRSRRLGLREIQ